MKYAIRLFWKSFFWILGGAIAIMVLPIIVIYGSLWWGFDVRDKNYEALGVGLIIFSLFIPSFWLSGLWCDHILFPFVKSLILLIK